MIDDNKHYMRMSAIMLAQRNAQSMQEKKKVRVKVHGAVQVGKDAKRVYNAVRSYS